MALIGNRSVLLKSPGRFLSGTVASIERSNFNKPGMIRNSYQNFSKLAAIPYGHLAGSAWVLPKRAGGMSAVNTAALAINTAANGVMGLPATGTASFSLNFAVASGQLISSGSGSAAFTIATNTPLLTASLNGSGSASFAITPTATPSAKASVTASGSFSITGTLAPYAIGSMSGTTVDTTVLTADIITASVWGATALNNNAVGSMGAKLNSAASGGVDYGSMADAVRIELQAELTRITDIAKIHGLVIGTDLVVGTTTRTAGDIEQSISESGGVVTIARQ
jgi:hypothetical protein